MPTEALGVAASPTAITIAIAAPMSCTAALRAILQPPSLDGLRAQAIRCECMVSWFGWIRSDWFIADKVKSQYVEKVVDAQAVGATGIPTFAKCGAM